MKTPLLLALSSILTAGLLPGLPAKIILSALVLLAALGQAASSAPVGGEGDGGFRLLATK
jgi:hypothetical protein